MEFSGRVHVRWKKLVCLPSVSINVLTLFPDKYPQCFSLLHIHRIKVIIATD